MKNKTMGKVTGSLVLIYFFSFANFSALLAQNTDAAVEEIFKMDLEELMNVKIVSASKKSENTFEAPFSSSVITKDEIKRAGCTSIMEAFRLMPALIVREQTNGNFDIHIRGLDNVPPNGVFVSFSNTTTLVMIDNRPVYNYLQGGTFWESLPVDLNDIEKIEVVRGPSSAMYGPNAVSGVIHIITRKPEKDKLTVVSNAQAGLRTLIGNTSVAYQFNQKLNLGVSGNFQHRKREEALYYNVRPNTYTTLDQLGFPDVNLQYPHPYVSMNKKAFNVFAHFKPKDKIDFNFSAGIQDAEVQNVFGDNLKTPISTNSTETYYTDFKFGIHNLSGQFSFLNGTQDPTVGFIGSKYDYNTIDGLVEYAIKIGSLTVKPGYNFRKAIYSDTKYWDGSIKQGLLSGNDHITTHALSLRGDVKTLNEKLRLFGGLRLDKFNYPQKLHFSYQLASTYSLNGNNLIRIVASKANRSPLVYDTFLDLNQWIVFDAPFPPYKIPILVHVEGSKDLDLVTSHMYEVGYRTKPAKNIQIDLDIFHTTTSDYSALILGGTDITKFPIVSEVKVKNLPVRVNQYGTTLAINFVMNKFQAKPFITVQKTDLKDYSPYYNTEDAFLPEDDPTTQNINTLADYKHEGTPAIFGGAYLNYQLSKKFNLNLNPYFYTRHVLTHRERISYPEDDERGVGRIDNKLILNAKISYLAHKNINVFINGKNILGDTSREFYRADRIGPNVLGGVNVEF